jgi:hypothetical protein
VRQVLANAAHWAAREGVTGERPTPSYDNADPVE